MMRFPRHTARLRLTVLYGSVFLVCGAVLLTVTYLLVRRATDPGFIGAGRQVRGSSGPLSAQPTAEMARQSSGSVQVAVRVNAFDMDQLLTQSGIALGIMAVAAVVLGWFIAGRILRPLSVITAAARRISASSLHERLALSGPDDELKDLSDTLDDLFARLEASFQAQRNFVANASHELRTPLTRERTLIQVALADPATTTTTWESVSRELLATNTEQERLIEALLTLTSSEGGLDRREPVDLAVVTDEVLGVPDAEIGRLDLRVRAATWPAHLDGDPVLIERLVANLIGNALAHNVADGEAEITTAMEDGRAVLSVTNTGPVIPPAEVERLFQPFQRLGPRRAHSATGGHGLGLSIVRAIAAAHGAIVTALARPGGGLEVTVTFPPTVNASLACLRIDA